MRYRYLVTRRYRRYRRYVARRYRRVARRYRRIPRWRFRSRGTYIRARVSINFTPSEDNSSIQIAPSISSFPELSSFYNLYETYQFRSLGVSCIPTANISSAEIPSLTYVCAPFHKPLSQSSSTVPVSNVLSLDKCRQYQGIRKSYRRYVPCVSMDVRSGSESVPAVQRYRPVITPQPGFAGNEIPHYCAIYAFYVPSNPITYTLTFYATVLFRDQKEVNFN
uniref:Capsid protein n=1 Tax=Circoviridae sp. TaxID=1954248 RepID=A0A6M3YP28_9VIRU|nr:MAG: capsid protein [Circoviridae sp.]